FFRRYPMKVGRCESPPPFSLAIRFPAARTRRAGDGSGVSASSGQGNPAMNRNAVGMTGRSGLAACMIAAALALAGCQTATGPLGEVAGVDAAQGSSENIASLTAVIERSPNDPEAYNVRGTALGRGGRYQE